MFGACARQSRSSATSSGIDSKTSSLENKWVQISSLLDSGSEVSLICHSYFKEHLLPRIETPKGEKADAHTLFNLMVANDGQLPMKTYVELGH